MSSVTTEHAPSVGSERSFYERHYFLFRRLHSLSGIVPVGIFVIFHLFTNFQLALGDKKFQHEVDFIHSLPALFALELGLWAAIAFHAGLGVVYTVVGAKPNVDKYDWSDNWRYFLQRVSGMIALIFIFLHIATLRWGWRIGPWHTPFMVDGVTSGTPMAAVTTATALQAHWTVVVLYIVGALAVVYHWANGLWTAAITWGVTLTPASQQRWGYFCLALGVVLAVFTLGAVWGAVNYEVTDAHRELIQLNLDYKAGLVSYDEAVQRATTLMQQLPVETSTSH